MNNELLSLQVEPSVLFVMGLEMIEASREADAELLAEFFMKHKDVIEKGNSQRN